SWRRRRSSTPPVPWSRRRTTPSSPGWRVGPSLARASTTMWPSGWTGMCCASRPSRAPTDSQRLCLPELMPRDLLGGNGSLLAAFDAQYRLADFYYPHVGLENHAGERFRFGIWTDEVCYWVADDSWQ